MKLIWLIGALVIVVVISGCTGQEKSQQQTQQTPTSTASGTAGVEIKDFAYNPATLTVSKGTTVTWTQLDSASHTVTSVQGKDAQQAKVLDSPLLSKGQKYNHTFDETGTFEYFCLIHPSMKGKVIVN